MVFQCSTDPYFCFWLSQPDKGKVRRTPADHGNPIQGIAGIPAEGQRTKAQDPGGILVGGIGHIGVGNLIRTGGRSRKNRSGYPQDQQGSRCCKKLFRLQREQLQNLVSDKV